MTKADREGVPRFAVNPFEDDPGALPQNNSLISLAFLLGYDKGVVERLHVGKKNQFRASQADLDERAEILRMSRDLLHVDRRSVHEIGLLLVATVAQMRSEFARKTVLDIGAGRGRFGKSLASKTKAEITFVDTDQQVLDSIDPKAGTKVLADGRSLPFDDDSFQRAVVAFSTLTWAKNPIESAQAFNEAVRVTEPGGSIFFVPAFTRVSLRVQRALAMDEMIRRGMPIDGMESPGAMNLWFAQDHVVISAMLNLIRNNRAAITWQGYIAEGKSSGETIESYSAVVDKLEHIPEEELSANVEYAASFIKDGVQVG